MSQERNIEWLNNRRVIYKQHPIEDVPTIDNNKYMFFEDGTHEHYSLFNTKAKINTYRSLKWHMLVLKYLNPGSELDNVFRFIANKENQFVTFFINSQILENMIEDVNKQGGNAPTNKLRKVIFKDYSMLTINEKLTIVGKLIGRSSKVDKESIYLMMIDINDNEDKISIQYLAELLGVSKRTIYRHMSDELKQELKNLNEKI